jgi:RNA polymerase sigma-70 factor (ECF subfamily)
MVRGLFIRPWAPGAGRVRRDDADAPRTEGRSAENPWTFDAAYDQFAAFVWRGARRLGVPASALEDVVQDVFVVVHRRLSEFEERTSIRAWLYAILIRVVRQHRRTARRKSTGFIDPDSVGDTERLSPHDSAEREQAITALYAILDELDDERREVFVLSELEQMTAPEIAVAIEANVNTVYWRLRTARRQFEEAVARARRHAARRQP